MANSIIAEGKTTNEAIENGLKKLHVNKNQVEIKVLENEDKRSFFSILAPRVVKVELTVKENKERETSSKKMSSNRVEASNKEAVKPKEYKKFSKEELEIAEKNAKTFLDSWLNKIGKDITYSINSSEDGLEISINGESAGHLIGYRGETLYALQNIIVAIASKGLDTRIRVLIDIEGYKEKREKTLIELAERMEAKVIRTGRSVTMEPMKAYERKIIHTKLQNSEKVTTRSIGEEPRRRLVISLK